MGEKPVGSQIQYWFSILVILVISINIVGITGVLQIKKRLNQTIDKYQPMVKLCEGIYTNILSSQMEAYKFLSGYTKNTNSLTPYIKETRKLIDELSELQLSSALNTQVQLIKDTLDKYDKTSSLLENSSTWDQKDQIEKNLISMGKEITEMALKLKNQAYNEISDNNDLSNNTMKRVIFLFLGLCGVSIIITFLEYKFWNKLQKILLKL
ncbi:MAG: hypothetical protein PHX78_03290 [bacterium]|nr:hypothetical protein [bacterium]